MGGANTVVGCDTIATKCYPYFKLMEKEEKRNVSVYFRLQQPHHSSKKSSDIREIYLANKLSIISCTQTRDLTVCTDKTTQK